MQPSLDGQYAGDPGTGRSPTGERGGLGATEPITLTYRIVIGVLRLLGWWGRLRVEGTELVTRDGPLLIVANHDSYWDPVLVGIAVRRRQVRALAKADLWKIRPLAPILRAMRQIPIERGAQDAKALADARSALQSGGCVGIFPEGAVSHGREHRARSGVGRLALEVDKARIVLCAIEGSTDFVRFPRRPRARVTFVDPQGGQACRDEEPGDLAKRLLDEIRARVPPVPSGRKPAAS